LLAICVKQMLQTLGKQWRSNGLLSKR